MEHDYIYVYFRLGSIFDFLILKSYIFEIIDFSLLSRMDKSRFSLVILLV